MSTDDWGQDSPLTDGLSLFKRGLLHGKEEQINLCNVTGLWVTDILLMKHNELNLILPMFACPLYVFSHQTFRHLDK